MEPFLPHRQKGRPADNVPFATDGAVRMIVSVDVSDSGSDGDPEESPLAAAAARAAGDDVDHDRRHVVAPAAPDRLHHQSGRRLLGASTESETGAQVIVRLNERLILR